MFPIDFSNPWIETAAGARRVANGWLTLVAACVVAAGSVVGGGWLIERLNLNNPVLIYLIVLGPYIAASLVAIFAVEGRAWPRADGPPPVKAAAGLVTGLVAFFVAVGLSQACGVLKPVATPGMTVAAVALSLGLMLFQVGAEELLFRGWLQPVLCSHWGPWVGGAVTAAVFSLMHLIKLPFSILGLVNILLAGLVFGALALRTGGLLAPFFAHFAWNYTEANIMGLSPNPGRDGFGSWFDFDLTGPAWLGGAVDGLNESLPALAALGLWLAAVIFIAPRRT